MQRNLINKNPQLKFLLDDEKDYDTPEIKPDVVTETSEQGLIVGALAARSSVVSMPPPCARAVFSDSGNTTNPNYYTSVDNAWDCSSSSLHPRSFLPSFFISFFQYTTFRDSFV
ncbi:unnamed protein product [Dibothriocephalus latus]|uniref:Uncharacterized protein n=1 Tax=Dibothriocephalus latus TaxID=60516 RepID=A0A3P7MGB2_DIBLA|nr:unnamed protein product [Dibothriocephalus latus]